MSGAAFCGVVQISCPIRCVIVWGRSMEAKWRQQIIQAGQRGFLANFPSTTSRSIGFQCKLQASIEHFYLPMGEHNCVPLILRTLSSSMIWIGHAFIGGDMFLAPPPPADEDLLCDGDVADLLIAQNIFFWTDSEGQPHTEGTFTRTLVNVRDLRRDSSECQGGLVNMTFVGSPKLRQTSPGFAKVRMKARACFRYTLELA